MAVIYADVLTRLDERSAKVAAQQLEQQFNEISARVGTSSSDSLGRALTSAMPGHGKAAAGEFMAGLSQGISGEMGGFASSMSSITSAMGGIGEGGAAAGLAAAAGIGLIATAAVKAGEALYGVGERFDAVFDSVAVRTGKAGDDLNALTDSIRNVATNTASSLEQVGDIGARVSQSLELTGTPLEDLTKQIADLNRMTGETLDIRRLGMMLRGFGEDGRMAGDDLDALTAASQRTGIPLGDLVSTLQTAGPAARSLGLDLDETAGLIVAFEKAGVDANKTTAGLSKAAQQFAEHNINLSTGLQDTITQIRGFIDAGNDAAAVDLAGKVFGVRSAQAFVDAIRQGTLSVQTLKDGLGQTGGTIENLDSQTADWAENWDILKNRVSDLASEIGGPLFDALNGALGVLNDLLEKQSGGQNMTAGAPMAPSVPFTLGGLLPGVPLPAGAAPPTGAAGNPGALSGQFPWLAPALGLPITGPDVTPEPQDIAGALATPGSGSTALPPAPQLPYDVGYGQPPAPGESQEQWQARMADMAAKHDLAEKQARLNQLESNNNATADEVIAARNAVTDAEMRSWQTQQRYLDARTQQLKLDVTVPYSDAYSAGPRPGQTASQYSAESSFMESQHKTAQAAATYQALMASGTATMAQLAEAHNNLVKAQRDENEASLRLSESYKKTSEQLGEIGTQLDADFGVSKGLPGIVENLTRFLAGLAAAPVIGALKGVQAANGGYDAKTMGSGMFGLGGLAAGMGPQAAPSGMPAMSTGGYAPVYSLSPTGAQPGGYSYTSPAITGAAAPSGFQSYAMPAGDKATYSRGMMAQLGIPALFDNPASGASPSIPDWVQQAVHAYGGPGLTASSTPHGSLHGTAGGPGYAVDVTGPQAQQDQFARYLEANPSLSAMMIHQSAGGEPFGIAGGQNVPKGSYFTTPGGTYADEAGMVHWAPAIRPAASGSPGGMAGTGMGIGPGLAGPPQAAPFGPVGGPASPSQSVMGGRAYGQGTPASGGLGFGGGLMGMAGSAISGAAGLATSGAAMGMDGGMGGAAVSAVAQIGIQEAQRAIGAAGQYAGALAGGLLETFSLNDSALGDPSKSWLGKIAGAVAGVRPALPNDAGKEGGAQNPNMAEGGKTKDQPPGPLTPGQSADQKAADAAANGGQGGPVNNTVNNNVSVTNQGATEDYTGQTIQAHLGAQAMAGQPR